MRTTLNIDDELMPAIRTLADETGKSLGAVVSDLIRRALRPEPAVAYDGDFPVFVVREDAPPITPEQVRHALEES